MHARARAKQSSVSGGAPRGHKHIEKRSTKLRRRRRRRRRGGGRRRRHYAVAQPDLDSELYAVRTALGAFPGKPVRQISQLRLALRKFYLYQSSIINRQAK